MEPSARKETKCVFRLYVTGTTPKSTQTITGVKRILEAHLGETYTLEVIDIYQQPLLARRAEITVAPTLVRERPLPLRRMVRHLCDESILAELDLQRGMRVVPKQD
jgi:circadian clock protein KaiB